MYGNRENTKRKEKKKIGPWQEENSQSYTAMDSDVKKEPSIKGFTWNFDKATKRLDSHGDVIFWYIDTSYKGRSVRFTVFPSPKTFHVKKVDE